MRNQLLVTMSAYIIQRFDSPLGVAKPIKEVEVAPFTGEARLSFCQLPKQSRTTLTSSITRASSNAMTDN